jgi:hypothetical protein
MDCNHTEHALKGDGHYGRYFPEPYNGIGEWEVCGMNEAEAYKLLSLVTSKNFNQDGMAIEWHPLALGASNTFEADVIEVGFLPAYYMYDENVWGEGALYRVTRGYDSLG